MRIDELLKLADDQKITGDLSDVLAFCGLIAADARAEQARELERLQALANTAEKWRGMASAKFGDGRTVLEVQREAKQEERDACTDIVRRMRNSIGEVSTRASIIADTCDCIEHAIQGRGKRGG